MSTCEQRWALHYTVERPSRAGAERRGPCCSGERRQSAPCAPTASSEKAVVGWTAPHAHTRQSERPPATGAAPRCAATLGCAQCGLRIGMRAQPTGLRIHSATAQLRRNRLGTHRGADEEDELCEREVGHARAAVGLVRAPLLELLCQRHAHEIQRKCSMRGTTGWSTPPPPGAARNGGKPRICFSPQARVDGRLIWRGARGKRRGETQEY